MENVQIVTDVQKLKKKTMSVTMDELPDVVKKFKKALAIVSAEHKSVVGLAGNQVNIPKQIFAIIDFDNNTKDKKVFKIFINPKNVETAGQVVSAESCVSFPKKSVMTMRGTTIDFESLDDAGNIRSIYEEGLVAQIIQHEIDHLQGLTMYDRKYAKKQGRNDKCNCGSAKKYKKCCGKGNCQ